MFFAHLVQNFRIQRFLPTRIFSHVVHVLIVYLFLILVNRLLTLLIFLLVVEWSKFGICVLIFLFFGLGGLLLFGSIPNKLSFSLFPTVLQFLEPILLFFIILDTIFFINFSLDSSPFIAINCVRKSSLLSHLSISFVRSLHVFHI